MPARDQLIKAFIDDQVDKITRKVTLTLWTFLVKSTPVDTGRARAGWQVSKETPSRKTPSEGLTSYPAPPPPTIQRGGAVYWIVNNVEYILVLDQGRSVRDGQMRGSLQAPRGMTNLALLNLRIVVSRPNFARF